MTKLSLAVVLGLVVGIGSAGAQSHPSRPITMIAPFPAGGPSDALARILSEPMRAALGQPVVIENVAGAGGNIGVGRLARAAPDGYTVGIGQWSTHVVNAVTYSLPYDVLHDFEPIALLAVTPQLIIARKNFPAGSVKELVAWLKANPDKATAATVGAAGGAQVTAMYFQQATETRFAFVPYRGGAPAMQDLVSGQVDIMFDQAANAIGQVRNGAIKAYAVLNKERWSALPEVPSIDEAGVPSLYVSYWHGLWPRRARLATSLPSSTARLSARSPIRPCASALPRSGRRSGRASSRRRPHWPRITRPKRRNGGRSSRHRTCARSSGRAHRKNARRRGMRAQHGVPLRR
jgi:tripartite-type tricarboxylate transporter receptor subunit TctC